jgi:small subunit ribosomal protein S5
MDEAKEKEIIETQPAAEAVASAAPATDRPQRGDRRDSRGGFRKNERKPRPNTREPRAKPEFDNKLLEIRRVARVVAGGRRFSFSASVVVGDRNGRVGVGVGKASDTPIAIEKAVRDGKKEMIKVPLHNKSIRHSVEAKYGSARIVVNPAPGKGIVAGSSARDVFEMAGISAVSAKFLSRSKNKINNARAAVKALSKLKEGKMERSKN